MSHSEVVGTCGRVRDRANEAARYLGLRPCYPAKPETLETALVLLDDLRAVLFDLDRKAMELSAMLEAGAPRRPLSVDKVKSAA